MDMRKFKTFRRRDELEAECKRRSWPFNANLYDEQGHDHVSIAFVHDGIYGTALVSLFNGRFFGELEDGTRFDSSKTDHEHEAWFQDLLEAVYV